MELYEIGNALLHYRITYDLSQDDICDGICSTTTLSRIEKGDRKFDSMITEVLIGRLGKNMHKYEFVLDQEDYKYYSLRLQIENHLAHIELEKAEKLICKYFNDLPKEPKLHQQFLLYQQFQIADQRNESREQLLSFLKEAICLTRPDYKDNVAEDMQFSSIEAKIIYHLYLLQECGEKELFRVIRFMEKYYDPEQKELSLFPIYLELVKEYEQQERYHELIDISQKAIEIKCTGRSFQNLADLHFCQVKAKYHLHDEKDALREMCHYIYYVYMIEENVEGMQKVKSFCEEELECQITG